MRRTVAVRLRSERSAMQRIRATRSADSRHDTGAVCTVHTLRPASDGTAPIARLGGHSMVARGERLRATLAAWRR